MGLIELIAENKLIEQLRTYLCAESSTNRKALRPSDLEYVLKHARSLWDYVPGGKPQEIDPEKSKLNWAQRRGAEYLLGLSVDRLARIVARQYPDHAEVLLRYPQRASVILQEIVALTPMGRALTH